GLLSDAIGAPTDRREQMLVRSLQCQQTISAVDGWNQNRVGFRQQLRDFLELLGAEIRTVAAEEDHRRTAVREMSPQHGGEPLAEIAIGLRGIAVIRAEPAPHQLATIRRREINVRP